MAGEEGEGTPSAGRKRRRFVVGGPRLPMPPGGRGLPGGAVTPNNGGGEVGITMGSADSPAWAQLV